MTRLRVSRGSLWCSLCVVALMTRAAPSAGQSSGVPLCTVTGKQSLPAGVAFPQRYNIGALVVVWLDERSATYDLRATVLAPGEIGDVLPADGVSVADATRLGQFPQAAAVGATSADAHATPTVIAYQNWPPPFEGTEVRVRRMFDGLNDWNVRVTTAAASQSDPGVVGDGGTGAWVSWLQSVDGTGGSRLRVQHLLADGTRGLGDEGIQVVSGDEHQVVPRIVSDGAGGVYLCWAEYLGGVYATRLTSSGAVAPGWPSEGMLVASSSLDLATPTPIADGLGGLYLLWDDEKVVGELGSHARVVRLLADDTRAPGWPAQGILVADRPAFMNTLDAATDDGVGGLLVTLNSDERGQSTVLSRISPDGSRPEGWTATGIDVCPVSSTQAWSEVVSQKGGALLVWSDARAGAAETDLYAARFLADGSRAPGWPASGLLLCDAPAAQYEAVLGPDRHGGAIFAWQDSRNEITSGVDIYGAWVNAVGQLSAPEERTGPNRISLAIAGRHPATGPVRFQLELPVETPVVADVFDASGRRLARIKQDKLPAGRHQLRWDAPAAGPPGVHFLRVSTPSEARSLRFVTLR